MAVVYRSDKRDPYVARITLCKGVPFYGFHVGYKFYLKIYLLYPSHMTRLADLLRGGAVLKQYFKLYEAHIPYILGFMMDFNLYGCGFIDCEKVRFRIPVPSAEEVGADALWQDEVITQDMLLPEDQFPRLSHCSLEVDIQIQDIINQRQIAPRLLHHDFIERWNPLPQDTKLVHSLAELWRDNARRRGLAAQAAAEVPSMTPSGRDVSVKWIHEDDYMGKIREIIDEERRRAEKPFSGMESFVRRKPFEGLVKTVVESVKDFFPENQSEYGVFVGAAKAVEKRKLEEEVEVDEELITQVVRKAEEEAKATQPEDPDMIFSDEDELAANMGQHGANPASELGQNSKIRLSKGALASGVQRIQKDDSLDDDDFDVPMEYFSRTAPKRLASQSLDEKPTPMKRQKLDISTPSPLSKQIGSPRTMMSRVPPGRSFGSQKSQTSLAGYPVVKSYDPEQVTRLSQEKASLSQTGLRKPTPAGSSKQLSTPTTSFLLSEDTLHSPGSSHGQY